MSTDVTLKVAVLGGGMFYDEIIGPSLADFCIGGLAGALGSIGMSHHARDVAASSIDVCAVGTRSRETGTADRAVERLRSHVPQTAAQAFYGEKVWDEILATAQPDVVFVATPDHLHTEPILAALQAGADVITEKPICLAASELRQIIRAADAADRIVAVDMHKRYDPFVRGMMQNARSKYGPINRVRAVLEEPLQVSTEVFAWAEHSNPFAYVGCHWLDVVHSFLNVTPVSVFATGNRNLLENWSQHHREVARRRGTAPKQFVKQGDIHTWDSLDVAVTYDCGMRGDFHNHWINPEEFEGAVNQELEVHGIYGRGFVDQQDRGFRETIIGDGSRTRNPAFGGSVCSADGRTELYGYGKASIAAVTAGHSSSSFRLPATVTCRNLSVCRRTGRRNGSD